MSGSEASTRRARAPSLRACAATSISRSASAGMRRLMTLSGTCQPASNHEQFAPFFIENCGVDRRGGRPTDRSMSQKVVLYVIGRPTFMNDDPGRGTVRGARPVGVETRVPVEEAITGLVTAA